MDTDDAAATANNGNSEKQPVPHGVERTYLLVTHVCDLTLLFLLADIHASSVVQETPPEEEPQPSSDIDDETRTARYRERMDRRFSEI
jgi:hypothetical protein